MKSFINEFKEFIARGNVFDMAVGIVIGGAFTSIVSSLVADIIMPIVGVIIGGIDFSHLVLQIGDASISYGLFIQNVIDFLIVAFVVFCFIKGVNKFKRKKEEEPEEPEAKAEDVVLLTEIRDILAKK